MKLLDFSIYSQITHHKVIGVDDPSTIIKMFRDVNTFFLMK